jgi:hypothetical protein
LGDPSEVENWVDYGAKVMAAADGEVIATLDGMKNNVPGKLPETPPRSPSRPSTATT